MHADAAAGLLLTRPAGAGAGAGARAIVRISGDAHRPGRARGWVAMGCGGERRAWAGGVEWRKGGELNDAAAAACWPAIRGSRVK